MGTPMDFAGAILHSSIRCNLAPHQRLTTSSPRGTQRVSPVYPGVEVTNSDWFTNLNASLWLAHLFFRGHCGEERQPAQPALIDELTQTHKKKNQRRWKLLELLRAHVNFWRKSTAKMTQTNGNNLCTNLKVRTSDDAINCQKHDERDPPRIRRRTRRGSLRVAVNGSVWGITDDTASVASPDTERKRRKSIVRNQKVKNLMRFVTNNCSERVALLQIATTPSEVCYRSHNSLSHKLAGT